MNKVFVITNGDGYNLAIYGIFTTEEKAEKYREEVVWIEDEYSEIEEHELDSKVLCN